MLYLTHINTGIVVKTDKKLLTINYITYNVLIIIINFNKKITNIDKKAHEKIKLKDLSWIDFKYWECSYWFYCCIYQGEMLG